MKTVFIMGASTGIGYECAKKIYRVAESQKRKMQYVVGKSTEIATLSKILRNKMVRKLISKTMVR